MKKGCRCSSAFLIYGKVIIMEKRSVTELGNPAKPHGEAGIEMLKGMNVHHGPVTEWALGFLDVAPNDTVLDIGCGGGATIKRIDETTDVGKIYGIDHSEISVELSTFNNERSVGCGKVKISQASVEALPFDNGSFDRIITVESFYFWPDPPKSLKEVYRVLKKGGRFLIAADIHGDAELDEKDIEGIKKFSLYNPTLAEFKALLENAGFINVVIHTKSGEKWVCAEGNK